MPKRKKRRYLPWTKDEIATLRRHSRLRTPVRDIRPLLRNRREGVIRQVAYSLGLRLGHRKRRAA